MFPTVKTAQMKTTAYLIKNVQDPLTKKIENPKLKESVALLICHEHATVCSSAMTLAHWKLMLMADKSFLKDDVLPMVLTHI